jgi:probable phosphoglycerate mutase
MSETKSYRQQKFVRPAGATEILLIRHGESRAATEGEPFPLVNGQGDPELAPTGREQAEKSSFAELMKRLLHCVRVRA